MRELTGGGGEATEVSKSRYARVTTLTLAGRLEEAEVAATRAVELDGGHPFGHAYLGHAAVLGGELDAAVAGAVVYEPVSSIRRP